MDQRFYHIALKAMPQIGQTRVNRLLQHFGNAQTAWCSSPIQWREVVALSEVQWTEVEQKYRPFLPEYIHEDLLKKEIKMLIPEDDSYPELLREISLPPEHLFIQGEFSKDETCIAIVGSRKASHYGKTVATHLAEGLADCGFTVVSGLAQGIDSAAHKGALLKGRTAAVLGAGHDHIYPKEHALLAREIQKQGGVISEYLYPTTPQAGFFPARNRIISGLSLATIVVEAKDTSGSLITATFALEQGREVFAVPGNIFSENSKGCHDLIKQGAKLVHSMEDVLDEFQYLSLLNRHKAISSSMEVSLTLMQQKVLSALEAEPIHIDQLAVDLSLPIGVLLSELTQLDLLGLAKANPGGYYNKEVL